MRFGVGLLNMKFKKARKTLIKFIFLYIPFILGWYFIGIVLYIIYELYG